MKTYSLLDEVLSAQKASGAFYSFVRRNGEQFPDENGFITALVLHELAKVPKSNTVTPAVEKGLEFLKSCASRVLPGTFHFYPPGLEPAWLGTHLPPDVDDTVLYTLTLVKHGALSSQRASGMVEETLEPHRLHYRPESMPPWVRQGAYKTWLDRDIIPNPVDCCVNTNAAALLKFLGKAEHPAYEAAVQTVTGGVHWVARSPRLAGHLSPFYPHPAELYYSMKRAIEAGAKEFRQPLARWTQTLWGNRKPGENISAEHPVCGSHDAKTLWFSPPLAAARTFTTLTAPPGVRIKKKKDRN